MAWATMGPHLGLQPPQLHQHGAVQAKADMVCTDGPGGGVGRPQDAYCSGERSVLSILSVLGVLVFVWYVEMGVWVGVCIAHVSCSMVE